MGKEQLFAKKDTEIAVCSLNISCTLSDTEIAVCPFKVSLWNVHLQMRSAERLYKICTSEHFCTLQIEGTEKQKNKFLKTLNVFMRHVHLNISVPYKLKVQKFSKVHISL